MVWHFIGLNIRFFSIKEKALAGIMYRDLVSIQNTKTCNHHTFVWFIETMNQRTYQQTQTLVH